MLTVLSLIVVTNAIAFVAGMFIGVANTATVNNAIATIKAAEAKAKATIDTITAHKAS